jgi:hypothetical protein
MEAIARVATIEALTFAPGVDSAIKALAQQFQELGHTVMHQLARQQESIEALKNSMFPKFFGDSVYDTSIVAIDVDSSFNIAIGGYSTNANSEFFN